MPYFIKKPVQIEAWQFKLEWDTEEVCDDVRWLLAWINQDIDDDDPLRAITEYHRLERVIYIRTLEGIMMAEPGDWIIKGIHGEFYPCKPSIFEESYSKINSEGFVEKGWRSNDN